MVVPCSRLPQPFHDRWEPVHSIKLPGERRIRQFLRWPGEAIWKWDGSTALQNLQSLIPSRKYDPCGGFHMLMQENFNHYL